jgi:tryptophan synthase alpha chain
MGWLAVEERLGQRRRQREVGLIPFLTVGYPDVAATLDLALALEEAGADVLELGVPFSDPLADGVTIQRASFHALRQGVTLKGCLEVCGRLRQRGLRAPLILMGYYNPILAYGIERLVQDAAGAGVDGFVVADLPGEEAGPFQGACEAHGLCNVPLMAPTSTEERVARACAGARGFVYCVSLTGVTGARASLPSEALDLVAAVRRHTVLPVAVGFGISRREQVAAVSTHADAVVVGSALLDIVAKAAPEQRAARAKEFLTGLRGTRTPVG